LAVLHRDSGFDIAILHQQLLYVTVGMRGFARQKADTPTGRVFLAAPSSATDAAQLAGFIGVEAENRDQALLDWLADCDSLAESILDLVSLGQGRLIRWSIRELNSGNRRVLIDFYGPQDTSPEWDGIFHHLNLQPVLDLALSSYTAELRERTGLRVALQWFVTHGRYLENQILIAMTALEHLVSVFVSREGASPIISTDAFSEILGEIEATLQTRIARVTNPVERIPLQQLLLKASRLNESPLRSNLGRMLAAYGVPLTGIEEHIPKAIAARNDVVHRGLYLASENRRDLYIHVAVLRELLKRIFLTLLGYRGEYHSQLNGPEWMKFPPSGVILEPNQA
jgi:hypothetical protein